MTDLQFQKLYRCREADMGYVEVLSYHLAKDNEENH